MTLTIQHCLVINLMMVSTGLFYGHQCLLLGILVLLLPFISGSKYLLPTEKINFYHWIYLVTVLCVAVAALVGEALLCCVIGV